MKLLIGSALAALLCGGCAAEKTTEVPVTTPAPAPKAAPTQTVAANENADAGTWAGQIKVGQPVSMFNYVGAESGDFAPMRFRNDSEAGKKILAACSNDDLCEFSGTVEWLAEPPPQDASAIGQIVSVESVKRLPPERR
jgi:hypothetical protein